MSAVNLRFGDGEHSEKWLAVIDKAREIRSEREGAEFTIPRNRWIRDAILKDPDIKKAIKALGFSGLEHPPERGKYERETEQPVEKPAKKKARAKK